MERTIIPLVAPQLFPRPDGQFRPSPESGAVRLRLGRPGRIDPEVARRLLGAPDWLGTPVAPEQPGMRRFVTDLALPLRSGHPQTVFRKATFVDLGEAAPVEGGLSLAIGWRSSTMAPLFPVFAGHLLIGPEALRLEGWYAPPGGEAGRMLDRAFLGVAARGTARWFLDHVGATLEKASAASATGEGPQPR